MMRLRLALLVLLTSCGSALVAAPWTGATVPAGKGSASSGRSVPLTASPAPSDLELFQVSFPHSAGPRAISGSSLTMTVSAPYGDDYLVLATPSFKPSLAPRALVLVVNRPSALLDPVTVRLQLRAAGVLGTPVISRLVDPFTHPGSGSKAALCDLSLHGEATLSSANLRTLDSHGDPLSGFGSSSAVSQAYDLLCGLPPMRAPSSRPSGMHRLWAKSPAKAAPRRPVEPVPRPPASPPCQPPSAAERD